MTRHSLIPPMDLRRLSKQIVDLQGRLGILEKGARTTQLNHSSLEGGTIVINDTSGLPRGYVGMQPDGTSGIVAVNGPPPSRPNTPELTPIKAGIAVAWNGELVDALPLDFSHILIYLSGAGPDFIEGDSNLVGALNRAGSLPIAPLPYSQHWARFIAVNTSGEKSEASFTAGPTTPTQVVGQDILDGAVTELKVANDAITAAKVATGAITETKVAPDAITTPKIAAGAVQAGSIAAGAIVADKIATNAVTADKILALAITADHISANAIEAGHILAGAVTADKLEAELVLANRIIVGTSGGDRVELHETNGLEQWRSGVRTMHVPPSGEASFTGTVTAGTAAQFISLVPADVSSSFPRMLMQDDTSTRRIAVYYQTNTLFLTRETISTTPVQRGGALSMAAASSVLAHRDDTSGVLRSRVVAETAGAHILARNAGDTADAGLVSVSQSGAVTITANGGNINLDTGAGSILRLWADGDAELISQGTLKAFVIDHPVRTDRRLVHVCTESPNAMVEYCGVAEVSGGYAEVHLPGYFEALCDTAGRTCQVTVNLSGADRDLPPATCSLPVDGRFGIRCPAPDGTPVSWRVTANRRNSTFDVEPLASEVPLPDGPYGVATPKTAA